MGLTFFNVGVPSLATQLKENMIYPLVLPTWAHCFSSSYIYHNSVQCFCFNGLILVKQFFILSIFSGKTLLLSPSSIYRQYNYGMFNRKLFSGAGYKYKNYYDDYANYQDKYNFGLWNIQISFKWFLNECYDDRLILLLGYFALDLS